MNRADIIRVAGLVFEKPGELPAYRAGLWSVTTEDLVRFAMAVSWTERDLNIACIRRVAARVSDEIDRARLHEAANAIRARGRP